MKSQTAEQIASVPAKLPASDQEVQIANKQKSAFRISHVGAKTTFNKRALGAYVYS